MKEFFLKKEVTRIFASGVVLLITVFVVKTFGDASTLTIDELLSVDENTIVLAEDEQKAAELLEDFADATIENMTAFTPVTGDEIPVEIDSQLMIVDPLVINDPVLSDPSTGRFSFKHLMTHLSPENTEEFTLNWLSNWLIDVTLNNSISEARSRMQSRILEPWLEASGGEQLDLDLAPFKLLAIANRMDLRQIDGNRQVLSAGEGRFVFNVVDFESQVPLSFTVIFEYGLRAASVQDVKGWALAWNQLGELTVGTPEYNDALADLTDQFVVDGVNSLNQVRTNEISLAIPWELREFGLVDGVLQQRPVALTPDTKFNNTFELASFISDNAAAISNGEAYEIPDSLKGISSIANFSPWRFSSTGVSISEETRHAFALNTCNGCHTTETGTRFLMIDAPSSPNDPARLAGFLTGTTVNGREFNDLERRKLDFEGLLRELDEATKVKIKFVENESTGEKTIFRKEFGLKPHMPNFAH